MSLEVKTELRIANILLGVLVSLLMVAVMACGDTTDEEDLKPIVVEALDAFAEELVSDRPLDADAYAERLQAYLEANPEFFGSASALLDPSGEVIASPYVYRTGDGYGVADLVEPSYNIQGSGVVYRYASGRCWRVDRTLFRRGWGGDIWMITRSVSLRDADGVFAVVTTDLAVDDPNQ